MATGFDGTFAVGPIALLGLMVWMTPTSAADLRSTVPHETTHPQAAAPPAPGQAAQPQPPAGKTLAPVTDPRCATAMPIVQTYKEVTIEEAKQPPRCDPQMR